MALTSRQRDYLLDKIIPALEGGEYRQGFGGLRPSDNTYCCLGVMVDVLMNDPEAPIKVKPWYKMAGMWAVGEGTNLETGVLPYDISAALFNSLRNDRRHGPSVPVDQELRQRGFMPTHVLTFLNDVAHASFQQIATGLRTWVMEQDIDDE